jgi:deoxycytidine triphosphate deaminase
MKLLTKSRAIELIRHNQLGLANVENYERAFLDDVRIGLRLGEEIIEVSGPVDLGPSANVKIGRQETATVSLLPGHFYLGISREELFLPKNVMGLINTRSKYARLGFELAKSSVYVAPGFGASTPTSLIFEITVPIEIRGLSPEIAYGFLLLFELDEEVRETGSSYNERFPLR